MNRVLINELLVDNLKDIIDIKMQSHDKKGLSDLFIEKYYRILSREHLFYANKARETIRLSDSLEEAKKFMVDVE